jgi:hypothetical protein
MSKIDAFVKKLSQIPDFSQLLSIIQSEIRANFSIIDIEGQSYIVKNNEENTDMAQLFHVSNAKRVIFIPIDGKNGLLGFGQSHCDCVIFDEYDCSFIEFKLNAISIEERAIRKNRKKAINQLSNTIELFDEKLGRNYEELHLEAFVCTPQNYPRDDAAWKSLAVAFLEKYGIDIFEWNEKKCK